MLEFLADNPVGHGVDIAAKHLAAQPVGLDERCAAAHEGVGDLQAFQIVGFEEVIPQAARYELRQQETAKQRTGPPGKPLVHGDDRTVVLLDLLLAESEVGDEGEVEGFLDHCGLRENCLAVGQSGSSPWGAEVLHGVGGVPLMDSAGNSV